MNNPLPFPRRRKAFTLMEVMIAMSIFLITAVAILVAVLTTNAFIRRQEMAFDVGNGANVIIDVLNRDSCGVGIVQVFSVSGTPTLPPYANGSWDGSGNTGNVLAIAYPLNRLDQNSPVGKLCLYYIDPNDNSLVRDELDLSGMNGGGVNPNAMSDMMAIYNLRFTTPQIRVHSTRLARVYPWALSDTALSVSSKKPSGIATFSSAPKAPQPLFSTEGPSANARPLAIMCTVAALKGTDAAKSTLLYTLNMHD